MSKQPSGGQPSFLSGGGQEDVMALKRKISMLEAENKQLKESSDGLKKTATTVTNDDRNWMSNFAASGGPGAGRQVGQIERPVTAST